MIWKRLKEESDRQNIYADLKRTPWELFMGDKVFLHVHSIKTTIKSTKLDLRFVGPLRL